MGYQELLNALERQVGEEREKLLAEADRRGTLVLGEAKREIDKFESAFAAEDFREAHLEREKLLAQVTQEAAIASLAARRGAMDEVDGKTRERLGSLRGKPSYRKLMETLMEEVLAEMPEVGKWTVDPRDVALVQQIVKDGKGAGAKVEGGEERLGGVTAWSKDGRSRVLNTFEARLAKAWAGLEPAIGAFVTGER